MRKFGAALAMGVMLATSACGGSSGSRPSTDEVSKALGKAGQGSLLGSAATQINAKARQCIAQALVDSKISDKALRALVAGDKTFKPSKVDEAAIAPATAQMMKCVSANLPSGVPTN